jgi:membrane protease YdiL (CAAX protease family)
MSILAAFTRTTAPTDAQALLNLVIVVTIFFAPVVAWRLRLFRRGGIRGPVRIATAKPIGPPLVVTLVAGAMWILLQMGYVAIRGVVYGHAHPKEKFDTSLLTNADFAFLSTVPFLIGLLIFLIGDRLLRSEMPRRIGYALENIVTGVGQGFVAMLVVLPVMWGASLAFEVFYRFIHFQHPAEHELLGAMKEAPLRVRALLIVGACVIAPVFEEFLFRGHIQTILVWLFTPQPKVQLLPPVTVPVTPPATEAGDAATAAPEIPPLPLDYHRAVLTLENDRPESTRSRWLAVVSASLIFAIFHPLWMAPLIFVLAICLGYAYERTGNLWVTITMHAIFNTCNTLIFLNFM